MSKEKKYKCGFERKYGWIPNASKSSVPHSSIKEDISSETPTLFLQTQNKSNQISIKSHFLFFMLMLLMQSLSAQPKWYHISKNDLSIAGLQVISGHADGWREQVLYHPNELFRQYPGLNRQWWDVRKSWQNKNDKGFLGQQVFVMFTDANHFLKGSKSLIDFTTIAISAGELAEYPKRDRWKVLAKKGLIAFAANRIGFATSYYLIHKNK